MKEAVAEWSRSSGISVRWPEEFTQQLTTKPILSLAESYDFGRNPCIDYGKFIERIPYFVVAPQTIDQLVSAVKFLGAQRIPYKTRGAAHSSGGQVLTDRGAVIDVSALSRILEDDPAGEQIHVEAGIWWLQLAEHLHEQGRRPLVLTDNFRTSVGGTLAVGGFGDTTHLYGLQIHIATALSVVTPDGSLHEVSDKDHLFQYTLAGRGQLGIIARARVKTMKRTSMLAARVLKWNTVAQFAEDAVRMIENRFYEFCRMRLHFLPQFPNQNPVVGAVGNFLDAIPADDPAERVLKPTRALPMEQINFYEHYTHDPSESWKLCSPSIEIILPLPKGLQIWQSINSVILKSGMYQYLPRGSSLMVLRRNPTLPLAPFPDSEYCMMVAVRPAMNLVAVRRFLPLLKEFGQRALDAGGKIYLMSIELDDPQFLEKEFGEKLATFRELKQKYDPEGLLNPGLL